MVFTGRADGSLQELVTAAGLELAGPATAFPGWGDHTSTIFGSAAGTLDLLIVDLGDGPSSRRLCERWLEDARDLRLQAPETAILLLGPLPRRPGSAIWARFGEYTADDGPAVGIWPRESLSVSTLREIAAGMLGEGRHVIPPEIAQQLVWSHKLTNLVAELSPREREILTLLADGNNHAGVAQRLGISEKTVENTLARVYNKLSLRGLDDTSQRVLGLMIFLAGRHMLSSDELIDDERRHHIYALQYRALAQHLRRPPTTSDLARALALPVDVVDAALGPRGVARLSGG